MSQFSSSIFSGNYTYVNTVVPYRDILRNEVQGAFNVLAASRSLILKTLSRDATETSGPSPVNPPFVWLKPGSSYANIQQAGSTIITKDFPSNVACGRLQNTSTTACPDIFWDNIPSSADRSLYVKFDFRPVSGSYDQWAFYLGKMNNTYATTISIVNGGLVVLGRKSPTGAIVNIPIPNIVVEVGKWYHVEAVVNPIGQVASDRSLSVRVTDSSNKMGFIGNVFFCTNFVDPLSRVMLWGPDSGAKAGVIDLDNMLITEARPTYHTSYIDPVGFVWDDETPTYLDEWSIYDVADPLWDFRVADNSRPLREKSSLYNATSYWDFGSFPTASYNDMALYHVDMMLSKFSDGIFLDDMNLAPNYNPISGSGYIGEDGRLRPGMSIFAMRDLVRRLAVWQYQKGMKPLVYAHSTNTQLVPILSFATHQLELEYAGGVFPGTSIDSDFQDRYNLDGDTGFILAQVTGAQSGNIGTILDRFDPSSAGLSAGITREHLLRTGLAVCLTHELLTPAHDALTDQITGMLHSFGYGAANCTSYRYWDEIKPVVTAGVNAKTLTLNVGAKALVIVASYQSSGGTCQITVDLAKLGVPLAAKAIDMEDVTKTPLTSSGAGKFSFLLPKHDFKVLLIQ
jgi:hypothetical protein